MFRNSFASPPSEPFRMMRIRPSCSTRKSRPEPSGASDIQSGRSCRDNAGKTLCSSICGNGCAPALWFPNRHEAVARVAINNVLLKLSKALAWTMLELHSANWVHRAFTPNNILLFGEQKEQGVRFDWDLPYLVGFDSSRLDSCISDQQSHGKKELSLRIYTHPDRQVQEYVRYQKAHDVYSLGVVLLEIGRLQSFLEHEWRSKLESLSPDQMRELFVRKARGLTSVLGQRFAKLVVTCLTGLFSEGGQEDDYIFLSGFHDEVCEPLADIEFSMCRG